MEMKMAQKPRGRSALPAFGIVMGFIVIAAFLPRFFNNSHTQVTGACHAIGTSACGRVGRWSA